MYSTVWVSCFVVCTALLLEKNETNRTYELANENDNFTVHTSMYPSQVNSNQINCYVISGDVLPLPKMYTNIA